MLELTERAFYTWAANPVTDRDWSDAHLINEAIDIHHDDPEFGYRSIADELTRRGVLASRNRVQRLCALAQLWSARARRRGRQRRLGPPVHDDLVRRRGRTTRAKEVWLTDVTEHPTGEGKLYRCAVEEAFSSRIVGYSIDTRMTAQLAVGALGDAITSCGVARELAVTVHSDRGSRSRSHARVRASSAVNAMGPMGCCGTCADNAAGESLVSLLQKNVLKRRSWGTRQELCLAIVTWIEATHHRRRRQETLGRLTPIECETLHQTGSRGLKRPATVSRPDLGQTLERTVVYRSGSAVPLRASVGAR